MKINRMKKIYTLLQIIALILVTTNSEAQTFEWVKQSPMPNYVLNPVMPKSLVKKTTNQQIIAVYGDSLTQVYSSEVFAQTVIEARDANGGNVVWKRKIGKKVLVEYLATNNLGKIYIGGNFRGTLNISPSDSLVNTGTSSNSFIICLNANGTVDWKRNITLTNSAITRLEYLNCNRTNGTAYYAYSNFSGNMSYIVQLSATGGDAATQTIGGAPVIGAFDFDANNNMYVTGSLGGPRNLVFGGTTVAVTKSYAMFLLRINAAGQGSWASVGNDITFQKPALAVTDAGDAYWGADLSDSITLGSTSLTRPSPTSFFVAKVNSAGVYNWIKHSPYTAIPTTRIDLGQKLALATDAAGDLYLTGNLNGAMDWGNGVVSNPTGTYTSQTLVFTKISNAGIAQWTLTGSSSSSILAHSITTNAADGTAYFSATCNGNGSFGNQTTSASAHNFVIGKITLPVATQNTDLNLQPINIFPNPTNGNQLNCSFYAENPKTETLFIIDNLGEIVHSQSINIENGFNSILINIPNLSAAVYTIHIANFAKQRLVKI